MDESKILRLQEENAVLRNCITRLRTVANSAGKWIQQAEVSVEPGWEGSTGHILRDLEEQILQTDYDLKKLS